MMGAARIIQRILDELKPGQTDFIEGKVICPTCVANGNRPRAQIFEWRKPSFKEGSHHVISLKMNATNFARAVIQVEITAKPRVLGFDSHRHWIRKVFPHVS